jgi:hypothetical protein
MAAWRVLREHILDQQWPAPISEDEVGASPLHLFIAISAAFLDIFARPGSSKVLDYIRIGLRVPVSSSLERVGGVRLWVENTVRISDRKESVHRCPLCQKTGLRDSVVNWKVVKAPLLRC